MAIIESFTYGPFDESDPDDFRPSSTWALLVDPGGDAARRVDNIARLHAVFPSERIGIEYLERNPAPGTEDHAPQPAFTVDARARGESG